MQRNPTNKQTAEFPIKNCDGGGVTWQALKIMPISQLHSYFEILY